MSDSVQFPPSGPIDIGASEAEIASAPLEETQA